MLAIRCGTLLKYHFDDHSVSCIKPPSLPPSSSSNMNSRQDLDLHSGPEQEVRFIRKGVSGGGGGERGQSGGETSVAVMS